jgi:hypothetical protein
VESTHILWSYRDGTWVQVTEKPKEQVEFSDDLPDEGEPNKIYVSNGQLYQWLNNVYVPLNNSIWEAI